MYNTLSEANAYFLERLKSDAWDSTSDTNKTKALIMASRAIDRLNFTGDRVEGGTVEFPRSYTVDDETIEETEVPDNIKWAECEIALCLLDDYDVNLEFDNANTEQSTFGNLTMRSNVSFVPQHLANGIVSATAWQYLKPYLRDPRAIAINRVN
jgi:hypothetical protein